MLIKHPNVPYMKKEGPILNFIFPDNRTVKYNLQTLETIGFRGKPVKSLNSQLQCYKVNDLLENFENQNYANYLLYVRKYKCKGCVNNLGTILSSAKKYPELEQYFSSGLMLDQASLYIKALDEIKYGYYCTKGNNNYIDFKYNPKALNYVKKIKINITSDMLNFLITYSLNPDMLKVALSEINYSTLTEKNVLSLVSNISYLRPTYLEKETYQKKYSQRFPYCRIINNEFENCIKKYNLNLKSVLKYFDNLATFEGITDIYYLFRDYVDYLNMASFISKKFEKYPKNFLTTHQITIRNYDRFKAEYNEELFKKQYSGKYNITKGDWIFIEPETVEDIKDEAAQQSNCVASYIDNIINEKCKILFLRKKSDPTKSVVTLEIRNNMIVQARQSYNNSLTSEQTELVDWFNNKFQSKIAS